MFNVKKIFSLISLIFLMVVTISAFAANNNASKPSYLFVQTARFATLKPDSRHPGDYILVLHDIPKYVTYFTDRPQRISGLINVIDFLQEWQQNTKDNFTQDAPNVDVRGIKLHWLFHSKDTSIVVSLSNPSYDVGERTMTYTAKPVPGTQMPNRLITLRDVALFFDDFRGICYSCCCN